MMIDHLPAYLRGLMIAAFAAAYMSTIATELNWGASYLVNDFYRRFVRRDASERHYVLASRIATVIITILSAIVTFYMDSIAGAWKWLLAIGAGTGGVLLARWYWWRVNAWSEVSSMIAAFVVSVVVQVGMGWSPDKPLDFAWTMIVTVAATTAIWIAVTFATKPEPGAVLLAFYRKVRPAAFGWKPVASEAADVPVSRDTASDFLCFVSCCVLIYGSLFGIGKLLLKETAAGLGLLAFALCGGAAIYWNLSRRGWRSVID
jgi:Na+/proline symporter